MGEGMHVARGSDQRGADGVLKGVAGKQLMGRTGLHQKCHGKQRKMLHASGGRTERKWHISLLEWHQEQVPPCAAAKE